LIARFSLKESERFTMTVIPSAARNLSCAPIEEEERFLASPACAGRLGMTKEDFSNFKLLTLTLHAANA
jgi:hypothetical protein